MTFILADTMILWFYNLIVLNVEISIEIEIFENFLFKIYFVCMCVLLVFPFDL